MLTNAETLAKNAERRLGPKMSAKLKKQALLKGTSLGTICKWDNRVKHTKLPQKAHDSAISTLEASAKPGPTCPQLYSLSHVNSTTFLKAGWERS
uniref:Uncharacterized protein n=1 Tax=Romanomermis culicivorax TaxID=13658 RepID=A0A915K3M6_ROMCU